MPDSETSPRPTPVTPGPPRRLPGHEDRRFRWLAILLAAVLVPAAFAVFALLPDWAAERALKSREVVEDPATQGTAPAIPQEAEGQEPSSADLTRIDPAVDASGTHGPAASVPTASTRATPAASTRAAPAQTTPTAPAPAQRPAAQAATKPSQATAPPASVPSATLQPTAPQDRAFAEAMTTGLQALDQEDWDSATAAFTRALAAQPNAADASDGLVRAKLGARLAKIASHRARAIAFEDAERWQDAFSEWEAILKIDSAVEAARDGAARSHERARIDERLAFHLQNPHRFSTPAVLAEAENLLERASQQRPSGVRLGRQKTELARVLAVYATPVDVTLESDGATEVTIFHVGRLGAFERRQLELRPGKYTVLGRCEGFRDVRTELIVEPGQAPEPLKVRCEEKL